MARDMITIDGNEAAAYVAHKTSEVIAIYPITPSSPMGEFSDEWSSKGMKNIWGQVPSVIEMQSEGGASGAVHGALQAGALTTTFTSSQGLLLMIPNMFKIAGELTSAVFHIAARSIACQGLSIFGDHADVMAVRSAGWGMLFGNSVQEVMDMALISQAATLEARVPFLNVFDGFRTSHEVAKIEQLSEEDIRAMIDENLVRAHRDRALTPDNPVLRGTAQNPDVYFQARETVNKYYDATPGIVKKTMDKFASIVGRKYELYQYYGAPDAERVIVMMGSGCDTAMETIDHLREKGEKIGMVMIRLFRPFAVREFLAAFPRTAKSIAVLDRCKEPGNGGEPLYQNVVTAVAEAQAGGYAPFSGRPVIVGGRYGLSSKEFTPAMVKAVFDSLKDSPRNNFTVGIHDDVTGLSLDYDENFDIESDGVSRGVFWGLGADGTVGANKNSIKIIGEETDNFAQGYFVYDSKKSGAVTISHLRFGKKPIRSIYLISRANFVAVHQFEFLWKYDVLKQAAPGATLLLNAPGASADVWDLLPEKIQREILEKKLKVYAIDAYKVAKETGMGGRINTIMQTCFFAISGVLPKDEAITQIKDAIKKTYGKRGESVVQKNFAAVDTTLKYLEEVKIPGKVTSDIATTPPVPANAPDFVKSVTAEIIAGRGDNLPVSKLPDDGTWPTGTTQWEKRNITLEVPVWETDICIQCGKCVLVCPHACIRSKVYGKSLLEKAPATFKHTGAKWREMADDAYTLQVAVEDCTGCRLCVEICPVKDKSNASRKAINMQEQRPIRETERENFEFFLALPDRSLADGVVKYNNVKDVSLLTPLFEFSGACAGCGETPYLSLVSRLYGDRAVMANATGCSSIYGGNLPTTPWAKNKEGRGPAWSNSLFEDNAEFGLGMRLAVDQQNLYARQLVEKYRAKLGDNLADAVLKADQSTDAGIVEQRKRVLDLREKMKGVDEPAARDLLKVADMLVKKSVWIIGGDGWAYDIGYGGLDHVLSCGRNVNVLVLDTEVYSNTGGQASKSTPLGAVAKFAAGGKPRPKKDLGMMAIAYKNVYVASIAMGAGDVQTLRAIQEAEAYDGPSLVIAYSHCIAHGIDISKGLEQQKLAVDSGQWPLYRYNPALAAKGQNPLQLDYKKPKLPVKDYLKNETRFTMLAKMHPEAAEKYLAMAQEGVDERWRYYSQLAAMKPQGLEA